ncbi:MAG TPA: response regulator [Rhodothermales bacterium]
MAGRVLLVDDDAIGQRLLTKALVAQNVFSEIDFFSDGQELLDYLQQKGQYAHEENTTASTIVLLDLFMPNMNGFDALKLIRSDERLKALPVIIFSGSTNQDDIRRSYELGANAYVVKPQGAQQVAERMKELVTFWMTCASLPEAEG